MTKLIKNITIKQNDKFREMGFMENVIEITGLKKYFGEVKAVDGIDFKVKRGELFAFLGVNGAGKSTTISIMSGTLKKDAGSVIIDGLNIDTDMQKISTMLGVVFQGSVLDNCLSVEENLMARSSLYGITGKDAMARIKYLAQKLEFENILNRPVGKLSGGQRRRIDVARALLHSPSILILDEPTTGLDPYTRRVLWSVINEFRKSLGMTVFLTTHYMEETVDADYVIILDAGKVVARGTPIELKNKYTYDYITIYGQTEEAVKKLGCLYEITKNGIKVRVKSTFDVVKLIKEHGEVFTDFEVIKGKMDDVFLTVTGKILEGGNN